MTSTARRGIREEVALASLSSPQEEGQQDIVRALPMRPKKDARAATTTPTTVGPRDKERQEKVDRITAEREAAAQEIQRLETALRNLLEGQGMQQNTEGEAEVLGVVSIEDRKRRLLVAEDAVKVARERAEAAEKRAREKEEERKAAEERADKNEKELEAAKSAHEAKVQESEAEVESLKSRLGLPEGEVRKLDEIVAKAQKIILTSSGAEGYDEAFADCAWLRAAIMRGGLAKVALTLTSISELLLPPRASPADPSLDASPLLKQLRFAEINALEEAVTTNTAMMTRLEAQLKEVKRHRLPGGEMLVDPMTGKVREWTDFPGGETSSKERGLFESKSMIGGQHYEDLVGFKMENDTKFMGPTRTVAELRERLVKELLKCQRARASANSVLQKLVPQVIQDTVPMLVETRDKFRDVYQNLREEDLKALASKLDECFNESNKRRWEFQTVTVEGLRAAGFTKDEIISLIECFSHKQDDRWHSQVKIQQEFREAAEELRGSLSCISNGGVGADAAPKIHAAICAFRDATSGSKSFVERLKKNFVNETATLIDRFSQMSQICNAKLNASAHLVQAAWRRHRAELHFVTLKSEDAAARRVQTAWRKAKGSYAMHLKPAVKEVKNLNAAARRAQTAWRRYHALLIFAQLKSKGFARGDEVEACHGGNNKWCGGNIARVNANGTYNIAYDDGNSERGVRGSFIRAVGVGGRPADMHAPQPMHANIKVALVMRPWSHYDKAGVSMTQSDEEAGEVELLNSKYSKKRYACNWSWNSAYNWRRHLSGRYKKSPSDCPPSSDDVAAFEATKITDQKQKWEQCGKKLLEELIDGDSVVLLNYGMRGSGKTYTAFGPDAPDSPMAWFKQAEPHEQWGLFPRLAFELFKMQADGWKISMKYFQNIGDNVRDLMDPLKREDAFKDGFKAGMRRDEDGFMDVTWCEGKVLTSWDELRYSFAEASARKATAPTQLNRAWTLGHCILVLEVEIPHPTNSGRKQKGRIYLCDLAENQPSGDLVFCNYDANHKLIGAHEDKHVRRCAELAKTNELQDLVKRSNNSLSEVRSFLTEMAVAIKAKQFEPGHSIPGYNSYYLCNFLKETMLQSKVYVLIAVKPEASDLHNTHEVLTFASDISVVKLKPKRRKRAAVPTSRSPGRCGVGTDSGAEAFARGDRVEARCGGPSNWFRGTVSHLSWDGTAYLVKFDDGGEEKVKKRLVRAVSGSSQTKATDAASEFEAMLKATEEHLQEISQMLLEQNSFVRFAKDRRFMAAMRHDARAAKPTFDDELRRIAKVFDGGVQVRLPTDLKNARRSLAKVFRAGDDFGIYGQVTDLLRGSLECENLGQCIECVDMVRSSKVLTLIYSDNRLDPSVDANARGGYRDLLLLVKCGRHICEVQINLTGLVRIKEDGGGHRVYEAARKVQMFDKNVTRHVGTLSGDVVDRVERGMITDLTLSGKDALSLAFRFAVRNETSQLKQLELIKIADTCDLRDLFPQSQFSSGVVQTLTRLKMVDCEGLTRSLEGLRGLGKLETLELIDCEVPAGLLGELAPLVGLQELAVEKCRVVENTSVDETNECCVLPARIRLGRKTIPVTSLRCGDINELDLSRCGIGDAGTCVLVYLVGNLVKLNVGYNSIDVKGGKAFGAALAKNSTLTELSFAYNSIGDEGGEAFGAALKNNSTLTTLNLRQNSISDESGKAFGAALAKNHTLAELDLSWNSIGVEGGNALGAALEKSSALTALHLAGNSVGVEGGVMIGAALETNTTLTTLDLTKNSIGVEGGKAFGAALKKNPTLTALYLAGNSIGVEGGVVIGAALETNVTLTELNLMRNSIGVEGGVAIGAALEKNDILTELNLAINSIGDEGGKALGTALVKNAALTKLNLFHNSVGVEGGAALGAALEKNITLTTLCLRSNSIGDEGGKAFAAALERNTNLTELSVAYNTIGDAGGKALGAALEKNSILTTLDLGFNSIGDEGGMALGAALEKNLTVTEVDLGDNEIGDEVKEALKGHAAKQREINIHNEQYF